MSGQPPKSGSLEVASAAIDDTVTVTLRGELDLASVGALQERLTAVEQGEPPRIVLDLSELSFIDSSGLRVLLLAHGRAREGGRELVLTQGSDAVQRVFEMTGTRDLLHFQS
ncbi:MAG TPA: STAS domain-containing protein [Solirubrobacteraceae bacterium]|jgi:anti-anti-sigma factor|nr:STAS domain-containing protein [Solirubrobacteraceae bacterium]